MAEGGGEVDDGSNTLCNICEDGGLRVKADQFCVSCEQYLCEDCKLYHSRSKASKTHGVVGINDIPSLASLTLGSEAMETPTCKDHQRPITHFCLSHMSELCPSCRMVEHKKCSSVTEFRKAIQSVFTEEHPTRIYESLEILMGRFNKCKDKARSNKDKLVKEQQSAIDNVKQARQSVDKHLDKIEDEAYAEIDKVFKAEMKHLDDLLHVCDVTINQLQKRLSNLDRATALDDKESEFVIINNVTKEIKHQCDFLKDSMEDTSNIDIEFEVSDNIGKMNKIFPNLGTVTVTKSQDSQIDPETVAIYTGEMKLRTTTDTEIPIISSYEALPDGRQLVTDSKNNKLKLYGSNNQFMSELASLDMPWNVMLLNDREAVVSLPGIRSLKYITFDTAGLAVSDTKKVNFEPAAMVKYGDDILATVCDRFWTVAVIDNRGTVRRTIYQDNGSIFSRPIYIGLSIDQKTVYVVDMDKGCIGLSMDGNVVFQYQDQKAKHYSGLAVGRNYLFIGANQGDDCKVRGLSLRGDYLGDMDLGNSRPRKMIDNNLIIFHKDVRRRTSIQFFYLL